MYYHEVGHFSLQQYRAKQFETNSPYTQSYFTIRICKMVYYEQFVTSKKSKYGTSTFCFKFCLFVVWEALDDAYRALNSFITSCYILGKQDCIEHQYISIIAIRKWDDSSNKSKCNEYIIFGSFCYKYVFSGNYFAQTHSLLGLPFLCPRCKDRY